MQRLPVFIQLTDFTTAEDEFNTDKWNLVKEREIAVNVYDIKKVYDHKDEDSNLDVTVIECLDEEDLIYSNKQVHEVLRMIETAVAGGSR